MFKIKSRETSSSMSNFDRPKVTSFTPAAEHALVVDGSAPRPSDAKEGPFEPKDMHTSGHCGRARPARMMTPLINGYNPWATVPTVV